MTPHVAYWSNIPAPYMVERFNAVAQRGNIELDVWFSSRTKSDRSWKVDESTWEFRYQYLPHLGAGAARLALPIGLLGPRQSLPDLLVSLYGNAAFVLGWKVARSRGLPTALWSEVTFDTWITRRRWKERVKSMVFPETEAILTAGKDGVAFAERYGARPERIFEVPHVIDFEYFAQRSALSGEERAHVREELGIEGTCFVYVGRLWSGKGIRYLIDAFTRMTQDDTCKATLLLVGDGVDQLTLRRECQRRQLDRVIFAGFHHASTLPRLYAASDVFVFPTLGDPFGMVVLEAMACGLPVISTTAAGEVTDRVADGVNGFLVPPGDSGPLSERMALLARDPELRRRMGKASAKKVEGQSPATWAEAFERAVAAILAAPLVHETRLRAVFRPDNSGGE